jgi:hypothetical protein
VLLVGALVAVIGLALAVAYFATHPTVRIERVQIVATTTLPRDLPAGVSYSKVKAKVILGLDRWWTANEKGRPPYSQTACVLPKPWAPGRQFTCTTFDSSGSSDGTATVWIESANPGEPFTIVVSWSAS